MRAFLLAVVATTLLGCGGRSQPAAEPGAAWPLDGFLNYLPGDLSVTLRLPSQAAKREKAAAYRRLLETLGRRDDLADLPGLDPARSPGLALTTAGACVRYLPAADKAILNRALGADARRFAQRDENDWVILSRGGQGAGREQGAALPPGDLALRVRFHPLLDTFFGVGDTLELGLTMGGAGLDLRGRLRPGPGSATSRRLARAHPGASPLLDSIPASLSVRIETTLPPTALAGFLTRRIAVHCGVADPTDRIHLERFFREVLTGVDPAAGMALGIDLRQGKTSVVLLGKVAGGPASPLLALAQQHVRATFGPLVLDLRREAPKRILGHRAWVLDPKPKLEGLPESAWNLVGDLCSGEPDGLSTAYARWEEWFVFGAGPRADLLVRAVRRRLREGGRRSPGSRALRQLRERGRGDYVAGLVLEGDGSGLSAADREALRGLLRAGPEAQAPRVIALAGFRRGGLLSLEGRVLY